MKPLKHLKTYEMCLYPKQVENRKYKPNKKNGFNPPELMDERVKYIQAPCGNCIECRKQKAAQWKIRLIEEHKTDKRGKFVTMTFSEEALIELMTDVKEKYPNVKGYQLDNEAAALAMDRFNERVKKATGNRIKHWLITELGQENTERIHIHGILWTQISLNKIRELWRYGNINKWDKSWEDSYCNEATIGYIIKYVNKIDPIHKAYKPIIRATNGIGAGYIKTLNAQNARYKAEETKDYYITRQGNKVQQPRYYRNKLYDDEEREKLWIGKIEKGEIWIGGVKCGANNKEEIEDIRRIKREENIRLGYGETINMEELEHENNRRDIKNSERLQRLAHKLRKEPRRRTTTGKSKSNNESSI